MFYKDTVAELRKRREYVEEHHFVALRKANNLIKEYNRLIYNLGCISSRHEADKNKISNTFGEDRFDVMKLYKSTSSKVDNLKVSDTASLEDYQSELALYRDVICKDLHKFLEDLSKVTKRFDIFKQEVESRLTKGNAGLNALN